MKGIVPIPYYTEEATLPRIAGVLACVSVGIILVALRIGPDTPVENLSISPRQIDLGDVPPNATKEFSFTVKNVSGHGLTCAPPVADCGCLSPRGLSPALPPDASVTLTSVFSSGLFKGPIERRILLRTANTAAAEKPRLLATTVSVKARVVWDFDYGPERLVVPRHPSSRAIITITTPPGKYPVRVTAVESPTAALTASVTEAASGTQKVEVTFDSSKWNWQAPSELGDLLIHTSSTLVPTFRVPVRLGP